MSQPVLRLFTGSARSSRSAPPTTPLTGGDVIRRYLADLEQQLRTGRVSADHVANVRRSLVRSPDGRYVGFEEIVGGRPLAELVQGDLAEWVAANPQWRSPETRARNLAAALACFRWAFDEEILEACPYAKTRRLQEPQVQRRDASDDEADRVFAAAPEALRRLLWFVASTGCRTKEARELQWSQIAWDQRAAILRRHKTVKQLREAKPRIIALTEEILGPLRQWQQEAQGAHIFVTPRGVPWTRRNLDQAFRRVRKAAGLPPDLTPYCFRHRFGTVAILSGLTERETGDLMGHASSASTRRYTHTTERVDHLTRNAERLERARAKRKASASFPLFDDEPE